MEKSIFCIARNRDHAHDLVEMLKATGLRDEQVSFVLMETSPSVTPHDDTNPPVFNTAIGSSTTIGGIVGSGVGAAIGLAAALGPVGPVVAAGPILALLAGAAAGGTTGGLIGALTGAGLPAHVSHDYSDQLHRGGVIVVAHPHDAEQERLIHKVLASQGLASVPEKDLNISGSA